MGLFKIKGAFFFSLWAAVASLFGEIEEKNQNYLLYLASSGYVEKALSFLPHFYQTKDYAFLQNLALLILESGLKSEKTEESRLTLYGAGVALSTHSLRILEKGLFSPDLPSQLIALHYLSLLQDSKSDYLIKKALGSDFLEVRAEALFHLCLKKDPMALGQMEALRGKLPAFFKPFFPQFLALIGTPEAAFHLKHYLSDENPEARLEAILSIAKHKREELLFYLKKRFKEASNPEKEALLWAFGAFGDTLYLPEFKELAEQGNLNLQIRSILTLNQLGEKRFNRLLLQKAKEGELLAISACAFLTESTSLLKELALSPNLQVKINAALALLEKKAEGGLAAILEILTSNLFLEPHFSSGRTLRYVQAYSTYLPTIDPEISLQLKEALLKAALELKENTFLEIAEKLIEKEKTELMPALFRLLENLKTPAAVKLLKTASQSSLPIIRICAHLALFRLEEKGPSETFLCEWIEEEAALAKIKLKNFDTASKHYDQSQFELSGDELSRLFLEILSSFVEKHSSKAPELLLKAMVLSPKCNRYPLSGLLLRSTE
ncbi:MAG: HEAT repeat domain-containing protein [Parachlamydiales bacterium]|jgi:HEAT repeat protein